MNILLLALIGFNIINLIDKVTTYIGLNLGFYELNMVTNNLIVSIGLTSTLILQFSVGLIMSVGLYFAIKKVMRFMVPKISFFVGYIFVMVNYIFAVVSNSMHLMRYYI